MKLIGARNIKSQERREDWNLKSVAWKTWKKLKSKLQIIAVGLFKWVAVRGGGTTLPVIANNFTLKFHGFCSWSVIE